MTSVRAKLPAALLIAGLAVLGLMAGAFAWRVLESRGEFEPEALIVLPEPRVVADFALVDHHGRPFTLADLKGRWSVLFFGFTSCPDICPNTLYQLQQVREELQNSLDPGMVPDVILVSVDPERDTPDKLADYLGHFDPAFIGVTGEDVQLRPLSMQLGVIYHVEPHEEGVTEYQVDHSASLLVMNPQGRLHGVLRAPHEAERIARDLAGLVERHERG